MAYSECTRRAKTTRVFATFSHKKTYGDSTALDRCQRPPECYHLCVTQSQWKMSFSRHFRCNRFEPQDRPGAQNYGALSRKGSLKSERETHAAVMSMMTMVSAVVSTTMAAMMATVVIATLIHHPRCIIVATMMAAVVVRGAIGRIVTATVSSSVATAAPCFCSRSRSSHPRQTCQQRQTQN